MEYLDNIIADSFLEEKNLAPLTDQLLPAYNKLQLEEWWAAGAAPAIALAEPVY